MYYPNLISSRTLVYTNQSEGFKKDLENGRSHYSPKHLRQFHGFHSTNGQLRGCTQNPKSSTMPPLKLQTTETSGAP